MSTENTSRKTRRLESRFQPIYVAEPSVEDSISILRGLKERYEIHHGVRIQDAAIIAAVTLSHRYITDRFLPDKAIDLIDEASSRLRIEIDSMPTEIDEIERRIIQLQIEEQALTKESDCGEQGAILTKSVGDPRRPPNRRCSRGNGIRKRGHHRDQRSSTRSYERSKTDAAKAEREGNLSKGRGTEIRHDHLAGKRHPGKERATWPRSRRKADC